MDQLKMDYIHQLLNCTEATRSVAEEQDIVEQCMTQQAAQLKKQIEALTLENQLLYMSLHQKAA